MGHHGSVTDPTNIHQFWNWRQTTDPATSNPDDIADGQTWVDTNTTPNALKVRVSGAWVAVGSTGSGYTDEQAQDAIAAMIAAGTHSGLTATYNDGSNSIDFAVTGGGLSQEQIEDFIGTTLLVAGTDITVTYNDGAGTITIDSTAGAGLTQEQIEDFLGTTTLVAGSGMTITYDDAANTITFESSGGGGGTYTDEAAQDAIGTILVDSSSINFTYTDATPEITAAIIDSYVEDIIDTYFDASDSPGNIPWLFTHRYSAVNAQPNNNNLVEYGGIGSTTISGTIATADAADGIWLSNSTGAALANQLAGVRSNSGSWRPDWGLTFVCRAKTGSAITSSRIWIGMASTGPYFSDTLSAHLAAFRYSTAAGDTTWKCCSSDNSGTLTITDSGIAVATDTPYRFRIVFDTTIVKFYIDDVLVATHTSAGGAHIPASGSLLGLYCNLVNLTTVDRAILFGQFAMGTLK